MRYILIFVLLAAAASAAAQPAIGAFNDGSGELIMALDDAGNGGDAVIEAAALENVWFNIIWSSGSTAGHPGHGSDGASAVERSWIAAGLAGLTDDDHSDPVCD